MQMAASTISSIARVLLRDASTSAASLRGEGGSRSASVVRRIGSASRGNVCSRISSHHHKTSSCIINNGYNRFFATVAQVEDTTTTNSSDKTTVVATNHDGVNSKVKDEDSTSSSTQQQQPRQRISSVKISEVLKRKHTLRWVEPVISKDATVREAITICIERKLNGMMVVDRSESIKRQTTTELKQKCVGLLTNRDILRMMASSIKDGKSSDDVLNEKISEQMTPINQVIYGRPDETIGMCRAIMAKLGIKCLPILSDGRVEGILTGRDMSDFYFDAEDLGGKKNYLRDVSERVGLTDQTSMAEPPVFVRQNLALKHAPLYMNVGAVEYPHPFKSHDGIGSSRRSECSFLCCCAY